MISSPDFFGGGGYSPSGLLLYQAPMALIACEVDDCWWQLGACGTVIEPVTKSPYNLVIKSTQWPTLLYKVADDCWA